jgi:hypothetical protein
MSTCILRDLKFVLIYPGGQGRLTTPAAWGEGNPGEDRGVFGESGLLFPPSWKKMDIIKPYKEPRSDHNPVNGFSYSEV